jgi:hypothetical protein
MVGTEQDARASICCPVFLVQPLDVLPALFHTLRLSTRVCAFSPELSLLLRNDHQALKPSSALAATLSPPVYRGKQDLFRCGA